MFKVAKFGGSSMADAKQFRKVKSIIDADDSRRCIVVSAPGKRFSGDHKITDLLYLAHAHIKYGVSEEEIFRLITGRYLEIRNDLSIDLDLESDFALLHEKMKNGISEAELVSRGEYFSAKLLAAYLGFQFIDAASWVNFTFDGKVDTEKSYEALRLLAEDQNTVISGFYGVMPDGNIALLSRGGSDITGALAAAALKADVYENWTDVSGILMADPRIVKNAKTIEKVTFSELRELSYLGAQVLHEETVFPLRKDNIPLNIRNTNDPSAPGTLIQESFDDDPSANADNIITGIAGKKGFTIITITKSGMSSKIDSLRKILEIFERFSVMISYAPSGIDCYSIVAESSKLEKCRYALLAEIEKIMKPDRIKVTENIAVLAVVGRKMVFRSGSSGKIFQALGEQHINIRMISQGPEELNILIGVKEKDFKEAIRVLYRNFVQ